jgi:membrane protease YdiL (CAAX protease family)
MGAADERTTILQARPALAAISLAVAFAAISAGGIILLGNLAPSLEGKSRDLIVEVLLALFVVGTIALLHWWRDVGLSGPASWRHLSILAVPALVVLIPFAGGFKGADAGTLGLLVVGYAVNSVAEDGMFSGLLPRILQSRGLVMAVTVSALLFGLVHFGNILSRPDQSVAITAAQAVGVFTSGIGYIAVRLVTRSLIPVMVVHFLLDLFLQLGGAPVILANVIQSTLLLVFGIWALRHYRREIAEYGWA